MWTEVVVITLAFARQSASLEHKLGDQILQVNLMDKPTDPPVISPSGCVIVRHVRDGVAHEYFEEDSWEHGDGSGTNNLEPLKTAASCSDEAANLTLEVHNIPGKWLVDEDMIKMVFEREKIGGGQVQTVVLFPNDRKAHVTFCEAHVPERLAKRCTIVHGRDQLHVRLLPQTTKRELQEPDPTEGTIEVSNVPVRFMDKNMLSTYFECNKKGGGEVVGVEILQEESKAFVTFRDPNISTSLAEAGSFTLGKESVLVSLKTDKADEDRTEYTTTPASSTLEVASIPDTFMNEEMLRLYFENPNKGGGEISDVVLVQHQAKALLTFLDHEVCHLLAQKGALRLGNRQVTVQLFVEEDTEQNSENAMLPFIELHGIPEHLQNASVVLIPEESKANITFCDPNVSLCLAEKGKVSIGKREVTINLPACEPQEEHLDTIEVSCLPDSWANEEMLRLYFENPIKGGGPICDITIAASEKKALVKFEDPQVASDFTAKGEIILGKSPVPIALFKPPPPVNPCTIELYDLDPSTLNEDVLRLYFENVKYNGGPITSVEIYPGVSRALITFTEQDVAQTYLDSGMLQVRKRTFKIRAPSPKESTKAPISNTIAVTRIPLIMSEYLLEALFSNELRTGGGPIEKIDVDRKQGSAIIKYQEAEVAERVVQKEHVSYKDAKLMVSLVNPDEKETTIDQKTVHVSPLPDYCSRDVLELSIETALGASDVIEEVVLDNDSAQITLYDPEMADKLVSLGQIKLPRGVMAAVEWMTTHLQPNGPVERNKLFVKYVPSEALDDDLTEFIEKGTRCEIKEVHYSPTKPGSVMLIFSSKPDYASMRILASCRPLCGISLCVEQVEESNWVQICPVEERDFEFLEYAVESDEWGGGSTLSDPIYNEEWKTALVQYTTHEGAINTCKKKKKFGKKEVDVREYFPDLGILPEDADYTSPDVWVPQPVEVDLTEKSRLFMKFKSAYNIFSLPQSNLDIIFKDGRTTMKCTLQPQQKWFYSLCQTWKKCGEAALVEFDGTITHQVLTVKYKEVWDQFVRDCTTQLKLLKDLSHVEVDASQLRVTVCGITNEVYDAIQRVLEVKKKLEEEHRHKLDTKEEILDLPEITVKLLEKASHIEELKQKYPDLNLSINEDQVVLYGHKKTLAAAKNDIMEITVSVCTEVISEESAKLKLMKLEKVREYIDRKSESYPFLYELDEANSNVKLHFLEEEHKQPVLDVLNNLWSERIELDRSGQRAVKRGQKWVATHRDLMEEYGDQLVIDISEDFIDVAGVGDETRKAYDTICVFMEKYITVSEYMDLKFAIVRYLKQFHKRNINEMHDRYQDFSVKVQTLLIPGKSAVIVDGMKDGVKDCMTDLRHLINGISDKQLKIDKPGPSKYFCTDEGVADLKSIEDKSRVVIHIPGVTDETLAEVESAEQRRARAMHTPILAGEVETRKGKLTVYFGDVCAVSHVDAVVCGGTNGNLSYHQGLGKALTDKAGIDVKRELRQHTNTCGTLLSGEVFMTSAGSLPFQHILHTIIPVHSHNGSGVEQAVDGVMKKLLSENIKSVAIQAMGVSMSGYSIEDSTSQIVKAVVESLKKQGNFKEVCFVGNSQDDVKAFKSAMIAKFKSNFTDHEQASKDETVSDKLFSLKSNQIQEQPKQTYGKPKAAIRNYVSLPHKSYSRTLIMTLCATGEANIQRATAIINQKADAVNYEKVIDDEAISYLTTEHRSDIKKLEDPFNLDITVDINKITLTGLGSDIMDVSKRIRDMLEEAKEIKKTLEKAIELAQTVKWMVEDDCYPVEINYIIEMAYNRGDSEVEFKLKGCEKRIRFKDMQVESPGITPLSVKRECKGANVFPADWVKMDDKTPYKLVPIADDSPSYRQVLKAMKGGTATPFTITKMEKVQIPTLYRKYVQHKEEMEGKSTGGTVESSNLWHGAQNDKLKGINTKGFDRFNLGQKRQDLGQGVYFYKSIQDAIVQQSGSGTPKYVYRCKVLTGSYTKGVANAREAPPIDPNKPTLLYDSCVDNPNAPAVFVAFKDMQAYPEILVTFQ